MIFAFPSALTDKKSSRRMSGRRHSSAICAPQLPSRAWPMPTGSAPRFSMRKAYLSRAPWCPCGWSIGSASPVPLFYPHSGTWDPGASWGPTNRRASCCQLCGALEEPGADRSHDRRGVEAGGTTQQPQERNNDDDNRNDNRNDNRSRARLRGVALEEIVGRVRRVVDPQQVQQHREAPGNGHHRALFGVRAAAHHQRFARAPQITRRPKRPEDVMRGTHQQPSPEWIPGFGDAQLRRRRTTLVELRHEPEIRPEIATLPKALRLIHEQHVRQRGDRPDARGLLPPLCGRIFLRNQRAALGLIRRNGRRQRGDTIY